MVSTERSKTWAPWIAFGIQFALGVYFFGQQSENTKLSLQSINEKLVKIDSNQVLLYKVITDVAVLQERQRLLELQVTKEGVRNGR